jgi:hypothetical protein
VTGEARAAVKLARREASALGVDAPAVVARL